MPFNHAKKFFKNVLYFHTFFPLPQIAPSLPLLGISFPNLVQGLIRPGGTTGDNWDESPVLFEHLFTKLRKMSPVIFQHMK